MKKITFIISLLTLVFVTGCGKVKEINSGIGVFAQCLNDAGAKMYGTDTCTYCLKQKALFGDSFQTIDYINCHDDPLTCSKAGITGFPTWKFKDGSKLVGKQSLESLGNKTNCVLSNNIEATETEEIVQISNSSSDELNKFKGEKGESIKFINGKIEISTERITDKALFLNTVLDDGNPVYFFVVRSPDGKIRAAANGCQVCGDALEGFHQEGDFMVCNTCGNKYPLNKIATEKGGCNPVPISSNLEIKDSKVHINKSQLKGIKNYFISNE